MQRERPMVSWADESRTLAWWPNLRDTRTRRLQMSAREVAHWFANPADPMPKNQLPGWSACTCNGNRASANVTELAAFVVDADGVPLSLADAISGLPCAAYGHTSASHGLKPGNRWRIVLWPDRVLNPEEYRACWPVIVDLFVGMGVDVDRKCSDLARLWFVPMAGPYYAHGSNGREPLAVSNVLELVRREEQASGAAKPPAPAAHTRPVAGRVEAYLARVEPAVSGQSGSTVTLNTACKVIRTFGLDADGAFEALLAHYNGRCIPPWSPRDLLRKCNEAERIVRGSAAS